MKALRRAALPIIIFLLGCLLVAGYLIALFRNDDGRSVIGVLPSVTITSSATSAQIPTIKATRTASVTVTATPSQIKESATANASRTPSRTATKPPTSTSEIPTPTSKAPTSQPPTATRQPVSATPKPPSATPEIPTPTSEIPSPQPPTFTRQPASVTPQPPTATRQPPSATPLPTATFQPPTFTPQPPTSSPQGTVPPVVHPGPIPYMQRFGVAASGVDVVPALNSGLPFGSYLNWNVSAGLVTGQVTYWQMIRLSQAGVRTPWGQINAAIEANPGAIWLIGNEPDVAVQDNVTPEKYASLYHQLFYYIKERDSRAKVAIAGVAQPTPLRRAYLDRILNSYQQQFGTPMPIDIWNVHGFILREEAGSWGAGIPPGMGSAGARLYEIEDNANLDIFEQNIIEFRAWMAQRGYGNRPLAMTEYGVVMPADYGFPPEVVIPFMTGSFDFMLSTANNTGYPADGNRLVQWWYWFSLYDPFYLTGNLYDRPTEQLTPLGEAWRVYLNGN